MDVLLNVLEVHAYKPFVVVKSECFFFFLFGIFDSTKVWRWSEHMLI
jgi:hypothetical protein